MVILSKVAFIQNLRSLMAMTIATLRMTKSRIIVYSTGDGKNNFFYMLWKESIKNYKRITKRRLLLEKNKPQYKIDDSFLFYPYELHYSENPVYNENWTYIETALIGERAFRSEYNLEFI